MAGHGKALLLSVLYFAVFLKMNTERFVKAVHVLNDLLLTFAF